MTTLDTQIKIDKWRDKARAGTLSTDDMREALKALREDRVTASSVSAKSRTAKAKAKAGVDSDDLLSQLEGI